MNEAFNDIQVFKLFYEITILQHKYIIHVLNLFSMIYFSRFLQM